MKTKTNKTKLPTVLLVIVCLREKHKAKFKQLLLTILVTRTQHLNTLMYKYQSQDLFLKIHLFETQYI